MINPSIFWKFSIYYYSVFDKNIKNAKINT